MTVMHADELPIDVALVAGLLEDQFPAWSKLCLGRLEATGSSNVLFRLGGDLVVRLPRQPGGTASIEKEARWLPVVAAALPVAVPVVVAVGEPGLGYPERWTVLRWLDGVPPEVVAPGSGVGPDRAQLARDLAKVARSLREIPVPSYVGEELRSYRGDALAALDDDTRRGLAACRDIPGLGLDVEAATRVWDEAMALPRARTAAEPRWFHGDLLAENLLVQDGPRGPRLRAVLDLGGLAIGDPVVDLVVAWEVLDPRSREVFRAALDVDEETWLVGRAWALAIAVMTFPYYWRTMTERCAVRLAMARSVLADASAQEGRSR